MIRSFIRKYKSLKVKFKEPDITYLENIDDFEKKFKIISSSLREKGYLFIKARSIFGDEIKLIPMPTIKLSIFLLLENVSINIPEIFLSLILISFGHLYLTGYLILKFLIYLKK